MGIPFFLYPPIISYVSFIPESQPPTVKKCDTLLEPASRAVGECHRNCFEGDADQGLRLVETVSATVRA